MDVLQVQSELDLMVNLYRELGPKKVLEIGVWHGGTLREWMVNAVRGAEIWAIDLEHPNRNEYGKWNHPENKLCAVTGRSEEPAIMALMHREAPFDWIFIDGDHGYDAVKHDVDTYLPMVRKGGVLLLHDIAAPDGSDDMLYPPGKVFATLAVRYETDAYVSEEPSDVPHGIGVVFV